MELDGKKILVTGGAARVGKTLTLGLAEQGAEVYIHFNSSEKSAKELHHQIEANSGKAHIFQADLSNPEEINKMMERISDTGNLYAVINNASIFDEISFGDTDLESWNRNLQINLTAPFMISQHFAKQLSPLEKGRIINILDWRSLRPGKDHFPYTISKAALASLTKAMAVALAPNISVNGIAFGAILPPSDGGNVDHIIKKVPAGRWAEMEEVIKTVKFLLDGPEYITGEIIHLDGGRHLI
jgi:pteridine reductase